MSVLPQPFVSVITGGTSGIGRATALVLAEAGSDVLINGRAASIRADIAVAALQARGAQARFIAADVSVASDVEALVEAAWAWRGRVDLWVNNAGADILSQGRYRDDWDARLEAMLAVDVWGTVRCCELVGERMRAQGAGHIINMGWDQAERGSVGNTAGQLFSLIKGGIMSYSRALGRGLAPEVRVNCVAPGWIETAWGEDVSRPRYEAIREQIPLKRWGSPEDIAQTILWLASPAANYITAQVIAVNGGITS